MRNNIIYIILLVIFLLIMVFYFLGTKTCEPPPPPDDDGDKKDDCVKCKDCDDCNCDDCCTPTNCEGRKPPICSEDCNCVECKTCKEDSPICLDVYNNTCTTDTIKNSNPVKVNSGVQTLVVTDGNANNVKISWTVATEWATTTYENYLYFNACLIKINTGGVCVDDTMSTAIYYTDSGSGSDITYITTTTLIDGCYIAKVRPALKNCNEYFDDSFSKQFIIGVGNPCNKGGNNKVVQIGKCSKGNTHSSIISEIDAVGATSGNLKVYNNAFYEKDKSTTYTLIWGIYLEDSEDAGNMEFNVNISDSVDITVNSSTGIGKNHYSYDTKIGENENIVVYNYELDITNYADSIIEVVISYNDQDGNDSNKLKLSVYNIDEKYPVINNSICYSVDTSNYYCTTSGDDDPYYCTTDSKINITWEQSNNIPSVPFRTLTYTLNFIKNTDSNPICSYVVDSTVTTINVIFREDDSSSDVCYISSDNRTIIIPGEINDSVYFNIVTNIAEYTEYDTNKDKSGAISGLVFTIVECLNGDDGDGCGLDSFCLNNKCRPTGEMIPIIVPADYIHGIKNSLSSECIKYPPEKASDIINIAATMNNKGNNIIIADIILFLKLNSTMEKTPNSLLFKMTIKNQDANTEAIIILSSVSSSKSKTVSDFDIDGNYIHGNYNPGNGYNKNIQSYYIHLNEIVSYAFNPGEYTITVNTIYKIPVQEPQMLDYEYTPTQEKNISYNISPNSEKLIFNIYDYRESWVVSNICINSNQYCESGDANYILTSDTITISWDSPTSTSNGYTSPQFDYNIYFYNNSYSGDVGQKNPLCILDYHNNSIKVSFDNSKFGTIEEGVNLPFEEGKVWFTVGARIRYSSVWGEITHTSGPDFYLVECIEDGDCDTGSICDITNHTCTDDNCSYSITNDTFWYTDWFYEKPITADTTPSYTFGDDVYFKWTADDSFNNTTYTWQIMSKDGTTEITESYISDEDGKDTTAYFNIYGWCLYGSTNPWDTVKLEAGTYSIKIIYTNGNCDEGSYTTSSSKQFTVIDKIATECTAVANGDYYNGKGCIHIPAPVITDSDYIASITGINYYFYCITQNKITNPDFELYWTIDFKDFAYNVDEIYYNINISYKYLDIGTQNITTSYGDDKSTQNLTTCNNNDIYKLLENIGNSISKTATYTINIRTVVKIDGNTYESSESTNPLTLNVYDATQKAPVSNLKYMTNVDGNGTEITDNIEYSNGSKLYIKWDPPVDPEILVNSGFRYSWDVLDSNDNSIFDSTSPLCLSDKFGRFLSVSLIVNTVDTITSNSCDNNNIYLTVETYYFVIYTIFPCIDDNGNSIFTATSFVNNTFTVVVDDIDCLDNEVYDEYAKKCVECRLDYKGDCNPTSTTLKNDSYARMAYEVNCSYADDISKCMNKQGYSDFDKREIPMTCQVDNSGKNVCARAECPPMSTPYTTDGNTFLPGCITPLNTNYNSDSNYDYSFNTQPDNKAASYDNPNYDPMQTDKTYNPLYGYPFIAIIEGGTSTGDNSKPVFNSDNILDLTQTSQKIAVPGMTDGKKVYLMPVVLQNFHPFITWRTFSSVKDDGVNPYTPYKSNEVEVSVYSEDVNLPSIKYSIYSLYHISSFKYLNTNTSICGTSKGDNGKSCDLTMVDITNIKRDLNDTNKGYFESCFTSRPWASDIQPKSSYNSCMTSSIWLDEIDANFNNNPTLDIRYNLPKGYYKDDNNPNGGDYLGGQSYTNNWNVPIDDKQNMVFFGKDTIEYASLYHRNDNKENQISHMRRWYIGDDVKSNSYFWTKGLGKVIGDNKASIDEVYKVIEKQWPNGPPYTSTESRGNFKISFSAPIQYGIVPAYKQTGFYLETYTWDETYKTFKGRGFISRPTDTLNYYLSNYNDGNTSTWKNLYPNTNSEISELSSIFGYLSYDTTPFAGGNYKVNSMQCISSPGYTTTGIRFLQNGYIILRTKYNNKDYCLCVNNKDNQLIWTITNYKVNSKDNFTPIMLAMSWPSQ
jgi:hypothetical protein